MEILQNVDLFEALISVVITFGVYVLKDFKTSMKEFNTSLNDMKDSVTQLNVTMAVIIEKDETKNIAINECRDLINMNRERIHEIEKTLPLIKQSKTEV